ncbi:CHC2 zinc finger domain-containing protein, partial [Escherichia coli]|nr:CHC2 zinc finger domain-containing protein [Escherichia coli]
FKCFGCGKGGNVFTFLMEIEGLSFPEAVRRVAEISGIPLPVAENISAAEAAKKQREREAQKRLAEQIVELNRVAAGFWHKSLFSGN